MCLFLAKIKNLFFISVLPAIILFSISCKHETPVLKEQVTRLPDHNSYVENYVMNYDETSRTLIFSLLGWTQIEEKVDRVNTGTVLRTAYGSPCSDFWMEYSLWNGQPRKHLMILAVPPLTVYPIVDTVILAGCTVCDCCIFPFSWLNQQITAKPVILTESQNNQKKEIVSELKMNQNLIFRDVVENRTSKNLVSHPIEVNDSGIHKKIFTDSQGRIKADRVVRWVFPIRNITFMPTEKVSGQTVQISTFRFLTSDQKKLWNEVKKKDLPNGKKLEAWKKLRPLCEPQYYNRVKYNIESGFYF